MADIEKPKAVAAQVLRSVREGEDPVTSVIANYAVGFTALVAGEFVTAQQHLQEGIELYSPTDRDAAEVYRFGQDPGVACYCYLALSEWALGYLDKAKVLAQSGLDLAHKLDDPFSVAFAYVIGSFVHQTLGHPEATAELANKAISLSEEKKFPYWKSIGSVMLAWADAVLMPTDATVETLKKRIADHRGLGTELFAGYFLTLLAEVALKADEREVCANALDEGEKLLRQTGERWWECETLRLRAELGLVQGDAIDEIQHRTEGALDIARKQGAKVFVLRTATSLAKILHNKGTSSDTHALLTAALEGVKESHDNQDFSEAKALLSRLS
jgi:predicted ATPase